MNLNELFFLTKQKYPLISNVDLYELIFFLSKSIKNKNQISLELLKPIDFNHTYFFMLVEKHCQESLPIERITSVKKFDNIQIMIDKNVFSPRQETYDWCLEFAKSNFEKKFENYIDLGTGTGLIPICLKKLMNIKKAYGIDLNKSAISTAKKNMSLNDVNINFKVNTIENFLKEKNKFNLITCNPPYIDELDNNVEQSALMYDPHNSLFAKDKGLYFYKLIIRNLENILEPRGIIIFEIGFNQKKQLTEILKNNSITNFEFLKDQNHHWRVLKIWMD